ncbi:hypothetical protein KJ682_11945 [bacterium]|nr:hypothetical protein [bacterium]
MHTRIILLAAAVLLFAASPVLAQSVPSSGSKEALVRVVSKWDGGCSGSERPSWDNMLRSWYYEITNPLPAPFGHGSRYWYRDGLYNNGTIVDSNFIDSGLQSWGRDHWNDRADDVDVFFAGLHGGHNNSVENWLGTVRIDEAGGGNCWANQAFMELGDLDLEFLHISSCHSLCAQNWGDWWDTFAGLHQVQGFYGLMWISTTYNYRYRNFADDAFSMGMAYAWVDNHFDTGVYSDGFDHCPVSMIAGTSPSNVVSRACWEQYDWVYSDPVNPNHQWIVFVEGCDPKGHGALNP